MASSKEEEENKGRPDRKEEKGHPEIQMDEGPEGMKQTTAGTGEVQK